MTQTEFQNFWDFQVWIKIEVAEIDDLLIEFSLKMSKFGLSLEKDAGYSKLMVVSASTLSGIIFAPAAFLGILTVQVRMRKYQGSDVITRK